MSPILVVALDLTSSFITVDHTTLLYDFSSQIYQTISRGGCRATRKAIHKHALQRPHLQELEDEPRSTTK